MDGEYVGKYKRLYKFVLFKVVWRNNYSWWDIYNMYVYSVYDVNGIMEEGRNGVFEKKFVVFY